MKLVKHILLITLLVAGFSSYGNAQALYRENPSRDVPAGPSLRTVPCAGDSVFFEGFSSGIPGGWTILDLDNNDPQANLQLAKGWQAHEDYQDPDNNDLVVSPSWYDPVGQSDDWLITPQITLGTNSCLSWVGYSQDRFFPEAYEVRISTTTADTAGFFALPLLDSIGQEGGDFDYRAVDLSAYDGQSVYLAFRQVSDDKFVLALDNIFVAEGNTLDAGAYNIGTSSQVPGDTVTLALEMANFGTDSLFSVDVGYSIDGGTPQIVTVTDLTVGAYQTFVVPHDSLWITDTLDKYYDVCYWTNNPNSGSDQRTSNDTICEKVEIGAPIAIDDALGNLEVNLFPNPTNGVFKFRLENFFNATGMEINVYAVSGQKVLSRRMIAGNNELTLDLSGEKAGMYVVKIQDRNGNYAIRRLILH